MRLYRIYFIILLLMTSSLNHAQDSKIKVITSTSIIADVAQNVGGDFIELSAIVPPNTDVHAFDPSPSDMVNVSDADLILINGIGLEAFLEKLLDNVSDIEAVVISNGIEILPFSDEHEDENHDAIGILGDTAECDEHHEESEHEDTESEDEHEHGTCDPHVWTSIPNVIIWTQNIADIFATADPDNTDTYQANADAYIEQLTALDEEIHALVETLPADKRIIVTNHEFMGYFAHEYGFEIVGTVISGGTSIAEPTPQDIADLLGIIQAEGIQAIFAEISSTNRLAEVIAQEAGIQVVVDLYSDSLSLPDEPAPTYLDYMRHNAETIVKALSSIKS